MDSSKELSGSEGNSKVESDVGGKEALMLRFPSEFRFGVATSAHQVEGGNENCDWWDFEKEPGKIADGTRSGAACEHYSRFREDLRLIRELNLSSYRFSVEWARIEPRPGEFDTAVIDHYVEVLDACSEMEIEPCVTLYHFTLPRWFVARGGWLAPNAPRLFERFVRRVARAFGNRVSRWVTLNEPMVYLYQGMLLGVWPPGHGRFPHMSRAGRNLIRAHIRAYRALHELLSDDVPNLQVGIAKHLRVFDPAREANRFDKLAARLQEQSFNWAFVDSLHRGRFMPPFGVGEAIRHATPSQDFLGINYYSRGRIRFSLAPGEFFGRQETTPGAPMSDLGWEIYPEGMIRLLRTAYRKYGHPLCITENGIADSADRSRAAFIAHHLAQVSRAIDEGIPVEGYYHWSLYDNFEWAEGFSARFGLYALDYETQERKLRASGSLLARIAGQHKLPAGALDQYRLQP